MPKALRSLPVSSMSRLEMTLVSWPSSKSMVSAYALRVVSSSRLQFGLRTSFADLPRS